MGMFDNSTLKKYNDAIPNYSSEDGIDIVKCTKECVYRDTVKNQCLFEACIANAYPYSIPMHSSFTHKCELCDTEYTIDDTESNPIMTKYMTYQFCPNCISKLKSLVVTE